MISHYNSTLALSWPLR